MTVLRHKVRERQGQKKIPTKPIQESSTGEPWWLWKSQVWKQKLWSTLFCPPLKVQLGLFTPINCTLLSCLIRCFRKFKVKVSGVKRAVLTINITHLTATILSSKPNESKGHISNRVLDVNVSMYGTYCYNALLPSYVWGLHGWMIDRQQKQRAPQHRPIPVMDKHCWISSILCWCFQKDWERTPWLIHVSLNTPMNNKMSPWASLWCIEGWLCSI